MNLLASGQVQAVNGQVNDLDPDERHDDTADAVENKVAPQQRLRR